MRILNKIASVFVSSLLALPFLVGGPQANSRAQNPTEQTTARGIQLYEQGDGPEAIRLLQVIVKQHPKDADAWYYLGLAFYKEGRIGAARPAFERLLELRPNSADANAKLSYALILAGEPVKAMSTAEHAIELGDQSAEPHYALAEASLNFRVRKSDKAVEEADRALALNHGFFPALVTKSLAQYSLKQYAEAAISLEQFLALNPEDFDAATWRGQLEELSSLANPGSNPSTQVFGTREVTQKARVLSKPEPAYSEAARKAGVTGTVVIRAIFAADGEVKHIIIVRALGYGLTTQAVKAARRIKFEPAIKDGQPVSALLQLEYNFNLY